MDIKNILEELKINDKVRINNWKPMKVKAVSKNYVLVANKREYSILCKQKNTFEYNGIEIGCFVCAPDFWLFGCPESIDDEEFYKFNDPKKAQKYLNDFESGKNKISRRRRAKIQKIVLQR